MDSVVHFEIPAKEPARSGRFYEDVFGWKALPVPGMDYTVLFTTPTDEKTRMVKSPGAINGGMMESGPLFKSPIITIGVPDMDLALKRVQAGGGKVVVPKTVVTGVGFSAYFADTDGNLMGLFQEDRR